MWKWRAVGGLWRPNLSMFWNGLLMTAVSEQPQRYEQNPRIFAYVAT